VTPRTGPTLTPPAAAAILPASAVGGFAVRGGLACTRCGGGLAGWAQAGRWVWAHATPPRRGRGCPGLGVPAGSFAYLLCFTPRYFHAGHYTGFAERAGLAHRLGEHAAGRGARLVQVVLAAGCRVELVRVWPDAGYWLERSLKNRHGTTTCPRCPSPPSRRLPRRPAQPRLFDPRPYQWPPPRQGVGW
jgi:hypothetical protein